MFYGQSRVVGGEILVVTNRHKPRNPETVSRILYPNQITSFNISDIISGDFSMFLSGF